MRVNMFFNMFFGARAGGRRRSSGVLGSTKHATFLSLALVAAIGLKFVNAEEEAPSKTGVAMSATLLGSISFIMCLYYFLNYKDEDIQEKAWETVSSTISIFCAVLLFSSFNDLVEAYIINPTFGEGDATPGALLVDMIHMLLWFTMMQLALAHFSGAAGPGQIDSAIFEKASKRKQEEMVEEAEVNMKCYAVLLAHLTGFAAINAFGTVQQLFFASSPLTAYLAVPVAFVAVVALQRVTDNIRERVMLGDDGEKDEFEKLWDEETEEAENDVMGLVISFLTIQATRFAISGCLPNQEGKEEECSVEEYLFHHSSGQKLGMFGMAVFFTLFIFALRKYWPESFEEEYLEKLEEEGTKEEAHRWSLVARTAEGLSVAVAMCFSWSIFYGTQMTIASMAETFKTEEQLLSVVLAFCLSTILMFGLIPLDWLADQDWTDASADRAIRSIMEAMALTIGFSWEQCFDACVDAIATTTEGGHGPLNPHTTKLALTVFCSVLIVPAWKWYMLPYIIAKGWQYGMISGFEDLERVAKIMVEVEHEDEETGERTKKVCPDKFEKVKEVWHEVKAHADMTGKKGKEETLAEASSYQALASDDAQALRKKNAVLVEELEKAKKASLAAQKMLDSTMESMFASLKQMNATVAKIEQQ